MATIARTLGIFVGSALTVVACAWAFGVPEFTAPLPIASEPAPVASPPRVAPPAESQAPLDVVTESPTVVAEDNAVVAPVTAQLPPSNTAVTENEEELPQWHAFWTPFRSELAADGFMQQLQRTTGLDYRIVKQERDAYEVAFAYASDDELEEKLSIINAATGLELPGS